MIRPSPFVLLAGLVFLPVSASAQWEVQESTDDFTDQRRVYTKAVGGAERLVLSVLCVLPSSLSVGIQFQDDSERFRFSDVEVRWDEGEIESPVFYNGDVVLRAFDSEIVPTDVRVAYVSFIEKLKAGFTELRVRVWRIRDDRVSDRFSLRGAPDAVAEVMSACGT